MNIKKIVSVTVLSAMLISSIGIHSSAQTVTVKIDDEKLECSIPARIENGSTMVPMRAIFEALGMAVEWNNEEKTVTATRDDDTIKLTIGEKKLYVNEKEVELNVAPFIDSDTTLVPVRAVSESVDATVEWDGEDYEVIITTAEYEANKDAWKENVGAINLTSMTFKGEGVQVSDNVVMITKGGDFEVTGENENAMLHVNTKEKVKLRLNGVKITNPNGPAIFYENTKKALITISKGSENYIADGEEYSVDAKAAIFSNDDIEIKGEGTLYVTSKAHHAIASDDDIKIEEGTLVLASDAKDGLHANNEIKITGGNVKITAKGDGIQAEENILIEGGEIDVTTTGTVTANDGAWGQMGNFGGRGKREWQNNTTDAQMENMPVERMEIPQGEMPMGNQRPQSGMMTPEGMENMTPPDGMTPPEGMGGMTPPDMPQMDNNTAAAEDEATATKGIKADIDITVTGGKLVVNSADHAIHSAGTITIAGGEMELNSAKGKGISAHGNVVINDGKITVAKATEGLESKADFTINGGDITVNASDDGINAGGTGGRDVVNRQASEQGTGHDLVINGGKIFVNASGDGLDANGRMVINGGDIVVEGPTNSGNGALDSGGVIKVNGGTIIALGASGMAETPDNDSKQATFRIVTGTNIAQGSVITITNAKGAVVYSYTTVKTGNSIVFSSPEVKVGETYTVKIGDTEQTVEMTSTVTLVGNNGGNMGGFGGGRGGRGW